MADGRSPFPPHAVVPGYVEWKGLQDELGLIYRECLAAGILRAQIDHYIAKVCDDSKNALARMEAQTTEPSKPELKSRAAKIRRA